MKKKILVIDDEADIRSFFIAVLKKNGYDVTTAVDAVEGLKLATEKKPDLIVLDLLMPKQSGTDFYRKLKRHKELASVPVIVVSGLAGRNLAVPKPAAVFDKPVEPAEFIAAVEKALAQCEN